MIAYLSRLDHSVIKDVIVTIHKDKIMIHQLIEGGCNMLYLPNRRTETIKYLSNLKTVIKNGNYDVIHIHGNSATMLPEVWLAKRYGIMKRIVHCHNSKCEHPAVNAVLSPYFRTLYTDAVACSEVAGNWLFGENNFTVIHNAIDLNRFSFSDSYRTIYRKKLSISNDCLLLGHIGGFNEQKNHVFLIDVFYELQKKRNAELILIGTGELLHQTKEKCERLGISQKVHFLGLRNDVERWLCAMDIFVFPSRWEGLGMAAIEAQATGLPVLASTEVPQEACLTTYMQFVSLEQGVKIWVHLILKMSEMNRERKIERELFSDYDISSECKKMLALYKN